MQAKSDAQLLRKYAEHGTEAAFSEIVTRHTDLVYSAVLRQVASPDTAAEVAQKVFIGLAQSARSLSRKLAADASLAGWLCRSARNLSLNHRRDEFRRLSRERQAMDNLDSTPNTAPDWERLRPVLDEAMSDLSEPDYDALVLRFFRNEDLRSVGLALGVSEDAAQKRVRRAIERLREFFAKRGVGVGAGGLASAISANAVQAAPVGLVTTISAATALTGTTLVTTATTTTTQAIAMTTFQKTLIATTLATAIGVSTIIFYDASTASKAPSGDTRVVESIAEKPVLSPTQNKFLAAPNFLTQARDSQPLTQAIAELRKALYAPVRSGTRSYPPNQVRSAILSFGENRREAFAVLKEAATDLNLEVRRRAISAMGLVGSSPAPEFGLVGDPALEVKSFLWEILKDDAGPVESSLAHFALGSLRSIGFKTNEIPALANMLAWTENSQLKRYIPEAISEIIQDAPDAAAPYLSVVKDLLDNADSEVQFEAACALARYELALNPQILAKLLEGLENDHLQQLMALETLQRLGSDAQPALQAIFDFANSTDDRGYRDLALRTMGKIDTELRNTLPAVDQALKSEEEQLSASLASADQDSQQNQEGQEDDLLEPDGQLRPFVTAKMSDVKHLVLGLMMYAADNQNQLPTNINQVSSYWANAETPLVQTDRFEIVAQGSLKNVTHPATTILVREREAWIANGHRMKVYGFADGHSEVKQEPPEGFDAWEQQHMIPLATTP